MVLCFVHTPRTGGTSVTNILRQRFPRSMGLSPPDFRMFFNLSQDERDAFDVLAGHMPFGVDRFLTRPTQYVVWVRDPVDRLISSYFHARMTPGNGMYEFARASTLLEYAENASTVMRDNGQTRRMASYRLEEVLEDSPFWWQRVPIGGVTEAMLEQAKEHLSASIVGLYEHFEESIRRLCIKFDISLNAIPHVNASKREKVLDERTLKAIRDACVRSTAL